MIAPVLHFSRAEFEQRIKITRQEMELRGLSLLILSDPSNMNWLTGYDGWSFYVHQCVVLGLHGDPIWFARGHLARGQTKSARHASLTARIDARQMTIHPILSARSWCWGPKGSAKSSHGAPLPAGLV